MRTTLIILSMLFVVACDHTTTDTTRDNMHPVKCVVAQPLKYVSRDFAALTTADDAVNLAFKIGGRVVDIPVAKGVMVKRGELLAELDGRDVALQVESARAAYTEARLRYERAVRLLEHDAISRQEVESLENTMTQARSAYENVLDLQNDTRITAPFDGVVERTYVDAFQRVASGETIVRVVNPVSTTVGFTAPESIVTILSDSTTRFSVEFDAYPDVQFKAVIKSFARTSSDALGFPVSLRLVDVDTLRYKISPGMTCIATVTTPQGDVHAVSLPLTAIYAPVSGGDYVWVVDSDNRVELRRVILGVPVGRSSIEILSGIDAGDRVVVAGVYKLKEGDSVRIIQ